MMFSPNVTQWERHVKVVHFGEVLTGIGWLELQAVSMLWFEAAQWKLNQFISVERDWTWPVLALREHNEGVSSEECPLRSDTATHNLHDCWLSYSFAIYAITLESQTQNEFTPTTPKASMKSDSIS